MKDKFEEECGVVGISAERNFDIYNGIITALSALQHRGQDGAGLYIAGKNEVQIKNIGLVENAFEHGLSIQADTAIGHVRYATCGNKSDYINLQPVQCNFNGYSIRLAHNGHIVNYKQLKALLEDKNYKAQGSSDSELIAALFCLNYNGDIVATVKYLQKLLIGAYSIVAVFEGQLFAFKDPYGIRPLVVGGKNDLIVIASETVALDALAVNLLFEPEPGEVIFVNNGAVKRASGISCKKQFCTMEYVYFSAPESYYCGKTVVQFRKSLVRQFAAEYRLKADFIIGVPDTAIPYAKELSNLTGIPYFGLTSDENFAERSFIKPTQPLRNSTAKSKLDFINDRLSGKKIIVVDDSIVRGTTAKQVVKALKKVGADEIHFAIISPPVSNPCWMGLDIATKQELLCGYTDEPEQISKMLGINSISFLSLNGLFKALETQELCYACFDGKYPECIKKYNINL